MDYTQIAQRIVERIEQDLRSRRGLRHEFEMIDPSIQHEIRDAWREIVLGELAPHFSHFNREAR